MLKKYIKSSQQKIEKFIKKKNVPVLTKGYAFLLHSLRPLYFSDEFLMLKGLKRKSYSNQQSIIFFTVHKSASTFIKNTVIRLLGSDTIKPIDLSGYFSGKDQKKYYNDPVFMAKVLKNKGYFYGAIRNYYHFPEEKNFKILLVLRDPRDVLTSHYFSTLYNHPLSSREVITEREKYKNTNIDEFVLELAPLLAKKYADYSNHLLNRSNVLFLMYENMISDFSNWLNQLAAFLNVEHKKVIIDDIIAGTSFKVEKENPNSFIRNVKAGDHKNKLKPETIEVLNTMFGPSMIKLGYEI